MAKHSSFSQRITKREVAQRWTPELVQNGWTPVADTFLELYSELSQPITNAEAMFIIHLIRFKWDEDKPYPSLKTIAKRMGVTDAQVRSHARNLEKKGYIRRIQRTGTTNMYDFEELFEKLEYLAAHVQSRRIKIVRASDLDERCPWPER